MHYKTMVLELLESRPEIHEQLRSQRLLLPTMDRLALELQASHEAWKGQLAQLRPGSDPSQLASEAMELGFQELERSLSCDLPPEEDGPTLDGAMAFIRRPTPSD